MSRQLTPAAKEELISHSVDVFTVLDESGIIQYESPSFERVFGYDPDTMLGEPVFEYIHPDDRKKAWETFQELLTASTGYETERVELRFRHNEDGWVWIESRGANKKGSEIGGYVVTSREITERKEYERRLKQERDRIEQFASFVSHDLRNPLRVAEGQLALAREECASEHLDAVARSHDRMATLIEDLLTLVREGETELQLDAIDLRETVEACWDHIETNDATVTIETDQCLVADESQLKQLVENLMRNAIEHGGETVSITVGELADGFYIADDGTGFPDEPIDSLTEYGFSTKSTGTGLGLSIVAEIVDNHGWSLHTTESTAGGARIEITDVTFADQ